MHPLEQYITKDGTPLREAIGVFAKKVKKHPSTIDRIIRGDREPSPDLIRTIFKITGGEVTADKLLLQGDISAPASTSGAASNIPQG